MRAFLVLALVVVLAMPQLATAAGEERRLERGYDGMTDPLALRVFNSPSCTARSDGSGDGIGGACWMLHDEPGGAVRITLEDDTFGPLPSQYWIRHADGTTERGLFCGQVDLEMPSGATFIAVFVDAHTPARTPCGLHVHGLHTTGTVTVAWLSD